MKTVCVVGLGYIGLPTAAMFASTGKFKVVGVDINGATVDIIQQGKIHINEPQLEDKVARCVADGRLIARTEPEPADAFILAVPTPVTEDKKADLSFVRASAEALVPHLRPGCLVILESTVPPRTTTDVLIPVLARSGLEVGSELLVAHCPERVLPGHICYEMEHNNRIIGGINEQSAVATRDLYSTFVSGEMYMTDATSAELAKLMENTYRDVNIALANEFARIGAKLGVDAHEAAVMANKHPRVNIHQSGPGVGGHCIAVDPWFIVEKAPEEAQLIRLSRNINDSMPAYVADCIEGELSSVPDPSLTLLGMSYKANVDDCRESPALKVQNVLQQRGFRVASFDPLVQAKEKRNVSLKKAAEGSDMLVLLVDHEDFRSLDPAELAPLMRRRLVLDTRNFLDPRPWREEGFEVFSLGGVPQKGQG